MAINFENIEICQEPTIDPNKVVDPVNLQNIHALIQSIIYGEMPLDVGSYETQRDWIARLESYAMELQREIYT